MSFVVTIPYVDYVRQYRYDFVADTFLSRINDWLEDNRVSHSMANVSDPKPLCVEGINFRHEYPSNIPIAVEFRFESKFDAIWFKVTWG